MAISRVFENNFVSLAGVLTFYISEFCWNEPELVKKVAFLVVHCVRKNLLEIPPKPMMMPPLVIIAFKGVILGMLLSSCGSKSYFTNLL